MKSLISNHQSLVSKKALGAVVAISLLIVVAVGSVLSFQSFYKQYSSDLEAKTDAKSNSGKLQIQSAIGQIDKTSIYIYNPSDIYTILNKITVNGNDCNILSSDIAAEKTTTQVNIDCILSKKQKAEIIIFSDFGVFTQTHIIK